ncbi:MAG TPA: radical SAM protein, partial [Sulfurimonas sp.]|nr:radical SAM protein [Sulfurimonas sp.]
MNVLLISTYDLGHQPFALASLYAHLSADGANVICNDVSIEPLNSNAVKTSALIGIHLAMHTATQLALDILPKLRYLNPNAQFCFFGLYAPMTAKLFENEKNMTFIGGEFETGLV